MLSSLESASSTFKYDGNDSIFWNDGDSVYVSKHQEEGWTKPIKLYETQDLSVKYAGYFETGEAWNLLLVTEDSENVTALQSLSGNYEPKAEMKVLLADDKERSEGKQPITFSVENTGDVDLSGLTYTLKDNGQEIASASSEDVLQIGDETVKTETFAISEPDELKRYTLELGMVDGTVLSEQEVVLGKTDLEMDVHKKDLGDKILLEVQIFNNSATPSDAAFTIKDGIDDGMILYIEHMSRITEKESYTYLYTFDKDKIAYNENGLKYYRLQIESGIEDSDMTNNDFIVVLKDESGETTDIVFPDDIPVETFIPVTGISVNQNSIMMKEKETKQIEASVVPVDATTQGIEYESSDYSVALVDENGMITAQAEGEAEITAATVDGAFVQKIKIVVDNDMVEDPETPEEPNISDTAENADDQADSSTDKQEANADAAISTGDGQYGFSIVAFAVLISGTVAAYILVKRGRKWRE